MVERYRQSVGPEAIQTRLPDSGGVDLAQRLSRAAKTVGDISYSAAENLTVQQGAEAGQREGAAGKPAPRTGLAAMSAYGRGYNSAAEAAYAAKIQTDIQTTLDTLSIDHEADPEGFKAAADGFAVGLHDSVPEAYRPWVAQALKGKIAVNATRLYEQQKIREDNRIVADALEGMDSAAKLAVEGAINLPGAEGDEYITSFATENRRRLEVMEREGLIQATDVIKYDAAFRDAVEKGLVNAKVDVTVQRLSDIARVDVEAAAGAMEEVWNNKALSQEEKTAISAGFEKAVSDVFSIRSRTHAEDLANLDARLAGGEAGSGVVNEARRLFRLGALSSDGYGSAKAASARNAKEAADKGDDISAVLAAIQTGQGLDPTDTDARKAVDTLFQATAAQSGVLPGSRRWQSLAIDTFRKTNILPESARSWARVSALNPDNRAAVAIAAQFMAEVRAANPTAAQYTADDSRLDSLLYQVNEGISAGVPYEESVGLAQLNIKQPKAVQDELMARYTKEKVRDANLTVLQNALNANSSGFDRSFMGMGGAPKPPVEMEAEFNERVRTNYMLNGGNAESARKQALEQVLATYRYTTINGKPEIMKWGVPVGQDDIVRQDLASSLQGVYDGDPTKLKLVPNTETERSRGALWSLVPEDENGFVFDVARGPDNKPLLYALPGTDAYQKAKADIREKRRQEAEAERAREEQTIEIMRQYQAPVGLPQ